MSAQTEALKQQLSDLIDTLIALIDKGVASQTLSDLLDRSLAILQKLQDDLSNAAEADILSGLKEHNQELADLNTDIDTYAQNLDATAVKIKSIADTIGVIAGIVAGIATSGIL